MQTYYYFTNELSHHGIKGQHWGVRRFQNEDGSYTPAGEERYNDRNSDGSIKGSKGRKRYGDNLDINDKSRKNIINIRLGEARRNYDIGKKNGADKQTLKDLKSRIKDAKRLKKGLEAFERGQKAVNSEGWSLTAIKSERKYEIGKAKATSTLKTIDGRPVFSTETKAKLAAPHVLKSIGLARKQRDIQKYYDNRDKYSKKNIGDKEYQDVLERRGKK